MGGVLRAVITPISIIDKDLGRLALQITATVAMFVPGGQPIAAAAALALATLYKPKGPKPEQAERSIKTQIPVRVSAYGKLRIYGAYILYATNEDGYSVDVWAFHDGKINKVVHRYLGDKMVHTNGSGFVIGQDKEFGDGNDTIKIGNTLGNSTEAAFTEVINRMDGGWTSAHRGDGVVTGFMTCRPVKQKNFNDVYPQGGPDAYPLSLVMETQSVYDWRDENQDPYDESTWKYSDNAALCTAHYLMKRANKDWDTHFVPAIEYWTAAADDCDDPTPVIHGGAITLDEYKKDATAVSLMNVNGIEVGTEITFTQINHVAQVTGISGNSITFSPKLDEDIKMGSYVTWSGVWTEPRYRVCLAHKHNETHKVVLGNLLACWDGMITTRGDGVIVPWSGRYVEPDLEDYIGPDEIVSYSWDYGIADEDQFNCVSVSYISDNHHFTVVDADEWRDESAILTDGEEKKTGLENSVPSHSQARRLAKRLVSKTMSPNRGSITTTYAGKKIRGKRFIRLKIEEAGAVFFDGVAEIVKIRRNLSTGGVTFDWIKADPNVDSWNPATEEGYPAPVENPVSPSPTEAVSIDSAIPTFVGDNNSAIITVSFDAPDRDDLTWYGRWRRSSDSIWNEQQYTDIDASSTVVLQIGPVPVDESIDVAVCYSEGSGALADWSATETVSTSTSGLASGPVTEVTSSGGVGVAEIAWRNPTTANFGYVRLYRNTTNTITGATQIGGDLLGSLGGHMVYDDTIAAGTYYYFLRAYSINDVASAAVGTGAVVVT